MIKKIAITIITVALSVSVYGQQPRYRVDWTVSGVGGILGTSNNHQLAGTAGQSIIGTTASPNNIVQKGFWVGFRNKLPYLPGDANMAIMWDYWPTQLIGSDVTYLVNYFLSNPNCPPCKIDNSWGIGYPGEIFWASGDANGDCQIIGSDVTRLVTYFRGEAEIGWCGDSLNDPMSFPPLWPRPQDVPDERPPQWPPCVIGVVDNIIPPAPGKSILPDMQKRLY